MADQPYVAIAAQYGSEEEAVADFDKIHAYFNDAEKHGSFDAAVVIRDKEGKVSIPKRDDGAKHHGVRKGLGIGPAGGLAVCTVPGRRAGRCPPGRRRLRWQGSAPSPATLRARSRRRTSRRSARHWMREAQES